MRLEKGEYQTRWYRKPSNKNILVHYLSAHPSRTKRSVVANMFRTAKTVSSNHALRTYSVKLARTIAHANGYPESTARLRYHQSNSITREEESSKIPLCIPFVCEELSSGIRNCVRRAGLESYLRVVDIPPLNLRHRLVRNRAFDNPCDVDDCAICSLMVRGNCMGSGVIYLIRCQICSEEYIGETGRPLRLRIKEHLDGLRRSLISTPLGTHRRMCHNNEEFAVTVNILAHEAEIAARKTLEAFWILARNPKMNKKDECIAITNELAPFLELGEFDRSPPSPERVPVFQK